MRTWAATIDKTAKRLELAAAIDSATVVYDGPACEWLALALRTMAAQLDYERELRRMSWWERFKFDMFCGSV